MMKKLAATLFTFLISGSAFALPLGNPWEASLMRDGVFCEGHCAEFDLCDPCFSLWDAWSFRIGFYGDYIYDADIDITNQVGDPTIHKTEIYTNAGFIALNLWDRLDIFATLGTSHIRAHARASVFGAPAATPDIFLETETDFSWSVGARATIWECGCFGFGIEGQYFQTCPEINYTQLATAGPVYQNGNDIDYCEWQVGIGAAYRINIASCATALVPYIGVKWSRSYGETDALTSVLGGPPITIKTRSSSYTGFAVGVTLLGCEKATVTVEGRFLNESAVHVNGQVRF